MSPVHFLVALFIHTPNLWLTKRKIWWGKNSPLSFFLFIFVLFWQNSYLLNLFFVRLHDWGNAVTIRRHAHRFGCCETAQIYSIGKRWTVPCNAVEYSKCAHSNLQMISLRRSVNCRCTIVCDWRFVVFIFHINRSVLVRFLCSQEFVPFLLPLTFWLLKMGWGDTGRIIKQQSCCLVKTPALDPVWDWDLCHSKIFFG